MLYKNRYIKYIFIYITFFILSVISVIILLKTGSLYSAGDLHFHLKRVVELSTSIQHKNFQPLFSFNYGHGAFVMGMYPYVSIIPLSLLLLITHSLIKSYYLFIIFVIFCSFVLSFLSSLKFSRSKLISYLFAIIYGMSSSFVFNAFITGDLGVITSLVFIPLVIFGFVDILYNSNNYMKFVIGMTCLMSCQLPSTIILFLFITVWLVINIPIINRLFIFNLIKAISLIMALTGYVWIPLFYFISRNKIHNVYNSQISGTPLTGFIENLGVVSLLTVLLLIFFIHKLTKIEKQMYVLSLVIIFISSKLMPWEFITSIRPFNLLNIFQFSFRFLIIPQVLLCYLFSYVFVNYIKGDKIIQILCLFIFIVLIQFLFQMVIFNHKINFTHINLNSYNSVNIYFKRNLGQKNVRYKLSNDKVIKYFIQAPYNTTDYDYYPKAAMRSRRFIDNSLVYNKSRKISSMKKAGFNKFKFYNNSNKKRMLIPLVKYNGENLHILDNNKLSNYNVQNHIICLNNVSHGNNIIKINYKPNVYILFIIDMLILLGLLWIILYFVF